MKQLLNLTLTLTLVSGLCAGVLAAVNRLTQEAIRDAAQEKAQAAVRAVLPADAVTLEDLQGDVSRGRNGQGEIVGYAAIGVGTGGYGGDIVLMAGFQADGETLVAYRMLQASETPGLGMKLTTPEFANQFAGQNVQQLAVTKDGGTIEAITSATITSRAVCRALQDAAARLKAARK